MIGNEVAAQLMQDLRVSEVETLGTLRKLKQKRKVEVVGIGSAEDKSSGKGNAKPKRKRKKKRLVVLSNAI